MATNTKQAKKELRKTIKKYLNKVGKVSGNKEIEPYLSQAEAEIGQQFDQAITTAVEEALGKVKLRKKKIDEFRPYPPVGHLASSDLQIKASKCFGYDKAINDLDKLLQTLKNKQLK